MRLELNDEMRLCEGFGVCAWIRKVGTWGGSRTCFNAWNNGYGNCEATVSWYVMLRRSCAILQSADGLLVQE